MRGSRPAKERTSVAGRARRWPLTPFGALDASLATPVPPYALFSQVFAPIPLDKADALIDAYCTQRVRVDFAGCRALGDGLGPGESEREWLNNGAKALQRN